MAKYILPKFVLYFEIELLIQMLLQETHVLFNIYLLYPIYVFLNACSCYFLKMIPFLSIMYCSSPM